MTPDTYRKRKPVSSAAGLGKLPPQAVDIEEAVLGALMLEKKSLRMVPHLRAPFFYKDSNQKIYSAIKYLVDAGQPADILTVTQQLKKTGELDLVGGPYYISQLTNRVASAANIEFHCRIILQKFILREIIRISTNAVLDAYEESTDSIGLLLRLQGELGVLNDIIKDESAEKYKRQFSDLLENISARLKPLGKEMAPALDALLEVVMEANEDDADIFEIIARAIEYLEPVLPEAENIMLNDFLKNVVTAQEQVKSAMIIECAPRSR